MSGSGGSVSAALLKLARRMAPPHRREWVSAMGAELEYLPTHGMIRWAAGCVLAALKSRLQTMKTGNLHINRWILFFEVIGCFGFLALAWYEATFGPSGVVRFTPAIIDQVFLSPPGGKMILALMLGFVLTGLVGPAGLYFGMRYVWSGQPLRRGPLALALIAAPVLQWLASMVGFLWLGTGEYAKGLDLFILLTLLPVGCILHLLYLGRGDSMRVAAADPATG